jgi:hypothetical protein
MNNARNILTSATRWIAVMITVSTLLVSGAFSSKAAPKISAKKSCCQRCACCIESNPDQPQVPLAFPTSSRASIDQPAALPLALVAAIIAQPELPSRIAVDFAEASHAASAPIFLRHCAILI